MAPLPAGCAARDTLTCVNGGFPDIAILGDRPSRGTKAGFSRVDGMTGTMLIGLSVALGCGLLIGIERERRKGDGGYQGYAGIRSFAVTAVTAALAQALAPALVVVGAVLIVALSVASYLRDKSGDIGITTEVALFATYLLGVNAIERPAISAAGAVVLAGLLFLREPLHRFSQELLTAAELRDGLLLAGAALIVLPLMPDRAEPLLLGVNPRRLWGLVTLILALQAAGHVGLRVGGPRLGLPLSGFVSGFISSIATIATMGARSKKHPALSGACVSGASLSNVATFVFLIAVVLAVFPYALGALAPALFSGLAAAIAVSVVSLLRYRDETEAAAPAAEGRAFDPVQAIVVAVLLTGVTVLVVYVNSGLGEPGVNVIAALTGIADVHVAAGSILSLYANGALEPGHIVLPVLLAITTNSISKLVAALAGGGPRFGARIGLGLALILAALWLPYVLLQR